MYAVVMRSMSVHVHPLLSCSHARTKPKRRRWCARARGSSLPRPLQSGTSGVPQRALVGIVVSFSLYRTEGDGGHLRPCAYSHKERVDDRRRPLLGSSSILVNEFDTEELFVASSERRLTYTA